MSNIQTWVINETTGAIPGVPGEFHAGQEVDVDTNTGMVIAVRLRGAPTPPDLSIEGGAAPTQEQAPAEDISSEVVPIETIETTNVEQETQ